MGQRQELYGTKLNTEQNNILSIQVIVQWNNCDKKPESTHIVKLENATVQHDALLST